MRFRHALMGLAAASSLGCFRWPDQVAYLALDYTIDRPRVVAIKLDPPVLAHGLPVRIEALMLAPEGFEVVETEVTTCGFRDDLLVEVWGGECFDEPELVTLVGTEVPLTWDPPDLSGIACPVDSGDTAIPWQDTGGDTDPRDTDADTDTGGVPWVPAWDEGSCTSYAPLLVGFVGKKERAYGTVTAMVRAAPYVDGEELPTPIDALPRSLEATGDVVAGGEIGLEFRIDAEPDWAGYRWYVDDGELLGTGRTATQEIDGATYVTRNTLRIPEDFHGPLRVVVVVASMTGWDKRHTGDVTWSELTLEVR
jgi:hypothetical protein